MLVVPVHSPGSASSAWVLSKRKAGDGARIDGYFCPDSVPPTSFFATALRCDIHRASSLRLRGNSFVGDGALQTVA